MRRKIPSTAALLAFEAAARHQSFTLAGHELSLTQSAVGRQIANLEELLEVKLFRRSRRGMVLTDAGRAYGRLVRDRLDDVERDALDLRARAAGERSLDLGVVPTFATSWLIPRLAAFRKLQPQVTVHLHSRPRPFVFEEEALAAAIYAGTRPWPGTRAVLLMPEPLVVVCSPRLAGARGRLTPAQAARLPLIQMVTRPHAWRDWFQAQGVEHEAATAGPRMELFSMAAQAAIHDQGLALVPHFFVEEELRRGALLNPVRRTFLGERNYYLASPGQGASEELAAFAAWIEGEAAEYARGLA